jgi:hypothetical protein
MITVVDAAGEMGLCSHSRYSVTRVRLLYRTVLKTCRPAVAKQLNMLTYGLSDLGIRQLERLVRPRQRFVKLAALGMSLRQRVQKLASCQLVRSQARRASSTARAPSRYSGRGQAASTQAYWL